MDENNRVYYEQMHEAVRLYQKELWGIPAVLFGLEGVIFLKIFTDYRLSSWLTMVLLFNIFALFMVDIYFEKVRDRSNLIQKKIDEFDKYFCGKLPSAPERISLYRGKYLFYSILESSNLLSATTWFRIATLFFLILSIFLLALDNF